MLGSRQSGAGVNSIGTIPQIQCSFTSVGSHVHNDGKSIRDIANDETVISSYSFAKPAGAAPDARATLIRDGWDAYAQWKNNIDEEINSFVTSWDVPGPPFSYDRQTLFIFNALEPIRTDDPDSLQILQPVLQHGVSAAGGGGYRAIASWYLCGDLYSEISTT